MMLGAGFVLALAGCQRDASQESGEVAYVSGANVEFRNELGPSSKVIGRLQSGERIRILSRRPRWAEVRGPSGATGWVLQRHLVSQAVYDQFAQLGREAEVLPSQGRAMLRRDANLHREPGRNTPAFYQLGDGEQVDVVGHRVAARNAAAGETSAGEISSGQRPELSAASNEDWFLVRASRGRTGWLLEGAADLNPPIEIAQYREGLRIRAWFEIYREKDQSGEHPWYLWATIRRLAGLPHDYDEIRVFVWNPRTSRYETSYRERNLTGFYPIVIGSRQTPDGETPTFRLQLKDSSGRRLQKNYFMLGRQVRVDH